jgi:HEAT repeat protein
LTVVHVLRAVDVLDFLEEYGIEVQNLKHRSALAGTVLVGLHLSVALFLSSLLVRYRDALLSLGRESPLDWEILQNVLRVLCEPRFVLFTLIAVAVGVVALYTGALKLLFVCFWPFFALLLLYLPKLVVFLDDLKGRLFPSRDKSTGSSLWRQALLALGLVAAVLLSLVCASTLGWPARDWVLWPLDNFLRTLDIGDMFQIYDWQIHSVKMGWGTHTLAILFRLLVGIWVAEMVLAFRLSLGVGLTVDELSQMMQRDDAEVRLRAITLLGEVSEPTPAIAEVLVPALDDDAKAVRTAARNVLAQMGLTAAPALIRMLADPGEAIRRRADQLLVRLGPDAVGPLVAALQDENERVRQAALETLEQRHPDWITSPAALAEIPGLLQGLANESGTVSADRRTLNQEILTRMGRPAVTPLVAALAARFRDTREAVLRILQQIDPNWAKLPEAIAAIPDLLRALKGGSRIVRAAAATALKQFGPLAREAVPVLVQVLEDEESAVRQAATEALQAIDPSAL